MAIEYWHRIIKFEILNDYFLKLFFNDDSVLLFNISDYFKNESIFNILKDKNLFNEVKIADDGRSLIFPYELDFCADSLWLKAHPEKNHPY